MLLWFCLIVLVLICFVLFLTISAGYRRNRNYSHRWQWSWIPWDIQDCPGEGNRWCKNWGWHPGNCHHSTKWFPCWSIWVWRKECEYDLDFLQNLGIRFVPLAHRQFCCVFIAVEDVTLPLKGMLVPVFM